MAKGIVTVTPRSPGTLRVTEINPANQYRIQVGQNLIFERPNFPVVLNDTVDFDPVSGTEARVIRVTASSIAE
jgi:hypothetical protein